MGKECASEIITAAKKLHPDALFMLPLYRSALVVLPQDEAELERGACTIILYHDPHWMGHDKTTTENLPHFKEVLEVYGQRSGPDLLLDGTRLMKEPGSPTHKQCEACKDRRPKENPHIVPRGAPDCEKCLGHGWFCTACEQPTYSSHYHHYECVSYMMYQIEILHGILAKYVKTPVDFSKEVKEYTEKKYQEAKEARGW